MDVSARVSSPAESQYRVPGEVGIWIFIIGDMLMFAMLFLLFTWDQAGAHGVFVKSQEKLHPTFGLVNTLLLLTSSWFVALALECAHKELWGRAARLISLGILFGFGFLLVKGGEYFTMISHGYSLITDQFFSYYFIITGLHFLHVIIGLVILGFLWRSASDSDRQKSIRTFENGACYWHMVDFLWIAIFPIIYLIR